MPDRPLDEWSVEVPMTAHHEGEYYLRLASDGWLAVRRGSPTGGSVELPHEMKAVLKALADPTKPVRIRLKMEAERIEDGD